MAGSVARLSPGPMRALVLPIFAMLAATRVVLLAHYPGDVLAGWGLGVLINRAVGLLYDRMIPSSLARNAPNQGSR